MPDRFPNNTLFRSRGLLLAAPISLCVALAIPLWQPAQAAPTADAPVSPTVAPATSSAAQAATAARGTITAPTTTTFTTTATVTVSPPTLSCAAPRSAVPMTTTVAPTTGLSATVSVTALPTATMTPPATMATQASGTTTTTVTSGLLPSELASLPLVLARPAVSVGCDGNIYVFGGTTGRHAAYNSTLIYHPHTDAWTGGATMPVGREGAQAVTLSDGKIAVLGGGTQCHFHDLCDQGIVYNRVDLYDPKTNTWSTAAPMRTPRYRFAAALYANEVYAIAGSSGKDLLKSVEVYSPTLDAWRTAPSIPQALEAPSAALDRAGAITVLGGFSYNQDRTTNVHGDVYQLQGAAWQKVAPH